MFDFGSDFDDSLFAEAKKPERVHQSQPYHVKTYQQEWFAEGAATSPDSGEEPHNVYKHRGDLLYYRGEYTDALKAYNQCLEVLDPRNTTVCRDVQESLVRCLMSTGQTGEAQRLLNKMIDQSKNFDQKTSILNLQADVCKKFGQIDEELSAVQSLVTLHAVNPDLWLRLGDVYRRIGQLEEQTSTGDNTQHTAEVNQGRDITEHSADIDLESLSINSNVDDSKSTDLPRKMKYFTCLVRARQLLSAGLHGAGSFAKTRMQQCLADIDVKLQELDISKSDQERCKSTVNSLRSEDEIFLDDTVKLDLHRSLTQHTFDQKWFPWFRNSTVS